MTTCFNCGQEPHLEQLPIRERIYVSDSWRIAHAWSSLPGWLVVISRQHLTSIAELTAAEASELGLLLRAASGALEEVVKCAKTYTMMFAEKPGFEHLHFHLVPRMADFDPVHRGAGVFDFINRPEKEWVSDSERDRLASVLADRIGSGLAS